jgi:DNA invertase Pin-like site-specific DNA recombinase
MNETQIARAKAMLAYRELPVRRVHEALHVSRATLYRHLSADRAAAGHRPAQRPRSRAFSRLLKPDTPGRDVSS